MADAWSFGGDSNHLLDLVLAGKKTATSSLFSIYQNGMIKLPIEGSYHVILDKDSVPRCVVLIEKTLVAKFKDIDEHHAHEEGEGDRSLTCWRDIHINFFSKYQGFSEESEILCEKFKLIWAI
ncbi:MAG: ASCH domain-containing protein [Bacteriovoracaceae bacterium]